MNILPRLFSVCIPDINITALTLCVTLVGNPYLPVYVTGFGKNGLIAGLVEIDLFPEKASTKFKYCLHKM